MLESESALVSIYPVFDEMVLIYSIDERSSLC